MDMHPWDPTAPFLQCNDNSEQVRQHGDYVIVGLHTDPEVNRWERRRSQNYQAYDQHQNHRFRDAPKHQSCRFLTLFKMGVQTHVKAKLQFEMA